MYLTTAVALIFHELEQKYRIAHVFSSQQLGVFITHTEHTFQIILLKVS